MTSATGILWPQKVRCEIVLTVPFCSFIEHTLVYLISIFQNAYILLGIIRKKNEGYLNEKLHKSCIGGVLATLIVFSLSIAFAANENATATKNMTNMTNNTTNVTKNMTPTTNITNNAANVTNNMINPFAKVKGDLPGPIPSGHGGSGHT